MILVWGLLLVVICVIIFRPRTSPFHRADRVLLVTAHPDDECMFFGPTLCHLADHKIPVKVVCLSTGNFYGQGEKRIVELANSMAVFDGAEHLCLDEFRDGPYGWEPSKLKSIISAQVGAFGATVIVTFDDHGVSGHRNHKSCAVVEELENVRVLYLESVSIWRKFTATLDLISTSFGATPFVVAGSWRSVRAMWFGVTHLQQ